MHKWTNLFVLGALFLMLAPSSNIMAINCAQALAIGHKSLIENGRRVQIVDSGIQILNHDVSKTLVYKTDRTFRMLELPRVVGHYGPGWQFDHYYVLGISDFGFHLYEAMGPDRMMVSAQKQPFARIEHIADYKIMNANITHAILTEYGPDNSPLLVVGAGTKVISFGFGESGFWRLGELDLEVPIKKMLLDRYVRPTSVASFGKRLFLGNGRIVGFDNPTQLVDLTGSEIAKIPPYEAPKGESADPELLMDTPQPTFVEADERGE